MSKIIGVTAGTPLSPQTVIKNKEFDEKLSKQIVTILKSLFIPITQEDYDTLVAAGTVDMSKYYFIKKEEVK